MRYFEIDFDSANDSENGLDFKVGYVPSVNQFFFDECERKLFKWSSDRRRYEFLADALEDETEDKVLDRVTMSASEKRLRAIALQEADEAHGRMRRN